jgi:hypothetical protein
LTRFDVTVTTTEKAYHHYSVGGELTIEDPAIVAHRVDEVACRWCGHGRSVEVVDEVASSDDVPSESTD